MSEGDPKDPRAKAAPKATEVAPEVEPLTDIQWARVERGAMERFGPPAVEALSDVAWARVERELWSRMDGTATIAVAPRAARHSWLWLGAPLVAAAAIAAIVLLPGHSTAPADEEPARVVAGDAPSAVSFGDSHITLEAHSAVVMSQTGDKPTALVEQGAAWFSVAPRGERPPFMVLAGDTSVRVIGTRFRVSRDGEKAEVTVDHGLVEVRYHGQLAKVGAHQTWSSEHPMTTTTVAEIDDSDIEIDPSNPMRPILRHVSRPHHVAAPATPPTAPLTTTGSAASDPDRARYESLVKLEAAKPDTAMKGYLELSQGSGAWAEVSLFAAGRLAVDRHDARAETFLSIYLRRFPAGANVEDARQLLARVTHVQGGH